MSIQFPDSPFQGQTFEASNGVFYTFIDGGWTANNADALDDRFVNLTGDTMTGDLTVPSLNDGQLGGFRNLIMNGSGLVSQRGLPFTAVMPAGGSLYSWDRWKAGAAVGSNFGAAAGSRDGRNTMIFNADAQYTVGQYIEYANVWHLGGKTVTLSYWAKAANSFTGNVGLEWLDTASGPIPGFGPGVNESVSVTTAWQYFTHTFTVPTTGTGFGNDWCLNCGWSSISANAALEIQDVQLEKGTVATPFEHRPIGVELSLCQRYYETSYSTGVKPGTLDVIGKIQLMTAGDAGGNNGMQGTFVVSKRTVPTVTMYSPNSGIANRAHVFFGAYTGEAAIGAVYSNQHRFIGVAGTFGALQVNGCEFHFTADAEL